MNQRSIALAFILILTAAVTSCSTMARKKVAVIDEDGLPVRAYVAPYPIKLLGGGNQADEMGQVVIYRLDGHEKYKLCAEGYEAIWVDFDDLATNSTFAMRRTMPEDLEGTWPLPSDHFYMMQWHLGADGSQVVLEFNSLNSLASFSHVKATEVSEDDGPALEVTVVGYIEEPDPVPADGLPIRRIRNGSFCAEIAFPAPATPELAVYYLEDDQRTPIKYAGRLAAPFRPYVIPEVSDPPF